MNNNTLIVAAVVLAAVIWYESQGGANDPQSEDLPDAILTKTDEAIAALSGPGPIANMSTSDAMLSMMRGREGFSAKPYNLGDGGDTWGYGHQGQRGENVPASISRGDAAALFAGDVIARAEKWVKLYVTVDLTQFQFDALVSIAFNMSPQSFKKFAASVNAGNGIDDIAQTSVGWVAAQYTNGIQNRRDAEMNVFDNGIYA